MNIVKVPLSEIEEAPFNYNLHPQNQIDELRGSLEEFGQFKNIVLWKGYCIAGNGLTFAARSMGWESLVATIRNDLTEEQAKRLCVADNATPYLAQPDLQKLEELLKSLPSFDDIESVNEDWLQSLGVFETIDFDGVDQAGASPWDRIGEKDPTTTLFTFGEISCNLDNAIYKRFFQYINGKDVANTVKSLLNI